MSPYVYEVLGAIVAVGLLIIANRRSLKSELGELEIRIKERIALLAETVQKNMDRHEKDITKLQDLLRNGARCKETESRLTRIERKQDA